MSGLGRRPLGRLFYWAVAGLMLCSYRGYGAEPQGAGTTTVADTVYLADGSPAKGTVIITWPSFVTGIEGMCSNKSGAEKKDAAMTFLQNAIAMTDAVASRDIVQPEQFKNGISQIIDGVVMCMNASTWAKSSNQAPGISPQ